MSIENARAFYEKVKGDRELQQRIWELAKDKPAEMEAVIIQLADANNFHFTTEDMRALALELAETSNQNGELNDAELEAVAGGSKMGDITHYAEKWLILSFCTVGAGCILSAVDNKKFNCV